MIPHSDDTHHTASGILLYISIKGICWGINYWLHNIHAEFSPFHNLIFLRSIYVTKSSSPLFLPNQTLYYSVLTIFSCRMWSLVSALKIWPGSLICSNCAVTEAGTSKHVMPQVAMDFVMDWNGSQDKWWLQDLLILPEFQSILAHVMELYKEFITIYLMNTHHAWMLQWGLFFLSVFWINSSGIPYLMLRCGKLNPWCHFSKGF